MLSAPRHLAKKGVQIQSEKTLGLLKFQQLLTRGDHKWQDGVFCSTFCQESCRDSFPSASWEWGSCSAWLQVLTSESSPASLYFSLLTPWEIWSIFSLCSPLQPACRTELWAMTSSLGPFQLSSRWRGWGWDAVIHEFSHCFVDLSGEVQSINSCGVVKSSVLCHLPSSWSKGLSVEALLMLV